MKLFKQNLVLSFLERINPRGFFLLLFAYQLLFIFQGFEMSDEGFNATFYQQIYRDPVSVQYNFMFWLTGIIGGAWTYLFSGLGLWGIRLAGVLVTTGTLILCYNLLKKHLHTTYLKLGLLLTVLFISNDTKEIYYNNISALLYIVAASLLFTALRDNKAWKFVACGIIIAFNVFVRLPSAMGAGLLLAIFYYGWLDKKTWKQQFGQAALFITGGIAGTGLILLTMVLMGHLTIFLDCLNWVINLGKSTDTGDLVVKSKDSSGYYGLMTQVKTFVNGIYSSVTYAMLVVILGLICAFVGQLLKERLKMGRWIMPLSILLALGLTLILLNGAKIFNYPNLNLLHIYTGFVILGSALILLGPGPKELKLLTFIAAYITLSYPIGSRGGITSAGIYCLWLSMPIIINYIFQLTAFSSENTVLFATRVKQSFTLRVESLQIIQLRSFAIYICVLVSLYSAYFFPFSDLSNRIQMHYSINNKFVRGIYTTAPRAQVMNELLIECQKLVKPGDYLLAYDAIPMIHYMTETKPYIKNSYPWLYTIPVLHEELAKAKAATHTLPVVIQQRAATNSHRSIGWPINSIDEFSVWNEDRNKLLEAFLSDNNYKKVWENTAFKIFVPTNSSPISSN